MFKTAINCKNYCMNWFEKCMHEPDVNSRLVFLASFVVTSLIMIAHTAVYLASKVKDPNYATVLTVLLGGHGVNALGRLMTKKGGGDDSNSNGNGNGAPPPPPVPDPPPPTPVPDPPK